MNSRRKSGRTIVAVWLAVVVAAATPIGIASAHESSPKFTLIHIKDSAYGRLIRTGRYDSAIARITARKTHATQTSDAATNLCVAYVASRDLANAADACDLAIDKAQRRLAAISQYRSRHSEQAISLRSFVAIAYSNRGVLRALDGADDLARADFEKARQLTPKLTATEANLARLAERHAETAV